MKTFIGGLFLLIQLAAAIFHIWTVIIALKHGIFSAIITFMFPVLSEIYWVFKMFGENNTYSILGIVVFILGILIYPLAKR